MASLLAGLVLLSSFVTVSAQAECRTATVGSPYSSCWDIFTNAGITEQQFLSYNPGLNCGLLQVGQRVCVSPGKLPSTAPKPNPDGTCAQYKTVSGDSCSLIATKFTITVAEIERFNEKTYRWTGCAGLQVDYVMCVSSGKPPPVPINPDAQCGVTSPSGGECPLKGCCSGSGFCGTTPEFCSADSPAGPCQSNCFMPTLPSCSGSATRKITYYAGWGARRSCFAVGPNEINLKGFSHVIFAFATISQGLQIQLDPKDDSLLRDLVKRKNDVSGLKVLIAIGGWAFSQDNPTKDLFSVMISTAGNRATFINSARSFISTYSLDGIDIDFEYPSSIERSGPPEDKPNLTLFMRELRSGLQGKLVTIAAPAGYWFLKGFDIAQVAANVDFINMMSYDYHGPWDKNVPGERSVSNPQSSIKDIEDSTLLYVRAGVDLKKVNLGLAWYGRSFELVNPGCRGYGCAMRGGGRPGRCTGESGVLSQSEIEQILNGNPGTLDSQSQTYFYNFGNDLITFDKDDTLQAKTDYANRRCFGGTFIWSHDQRLPGGTPITNPDGPCGFHFIQYQKPNPATDPYRFSVKLVGPYGELLGEVDRAIGRPGQPIRVKSILADDLEVIAGNVDADPVRFRYRGFDWDSHGSHCRTGGYEKGDREGDCGFNCVLPPVPFCPGREAQQRLGLFPNISMSDADHKPSYSG